jgi:predicted nucleic acid-binding protein
MSALVDTNILVYAIDSSQGRKHERSMELVKKIFLEGGGAVSAQILSEFFVVSTKKLAKPLQAREAITFVKAVCESGNWEKMSHSHETVLKAAVLSAEERMEFWDALVAETMLENGVKEILTENDRDFRRIRGIKVVNPFK